MQHIIDNGIDRMDRTGTGTRSVFGVQMRFDLQNGFPAVTTKRLWMKGVIYELLWMLSGNTNIEYLTSNGVHIWDEWADKNGDLGPVYGAQWRKWKTLYPAGLGSYEIDQIKTVIEGIKNKPHSRRHIVSAWNVAELDNMNLPPCHLLFQFYVANSELSCMLTQRSQDFFLGAPYNIASYSILTHMIAQICKLKVGSLIVSVGDCHIYHNHMDQVKEQLSREPYELPTLWLNPNVENIDDFKYEDIKLENYKCHKTIKAPIAV
jgi:thymidylate synthase